MINKIHSITLMYILLVFAFVSTCFAEDSTSTESNIFTFVTNGDISAVDELLKNGINPNIKSKTGSTPLLIASAREKTDIAILLLNHGADPNLPGKLMETPLMHAIITSNRILAQELLLRGANPNAKDFFNQSALDIAKKLTLNYMVILMENQQNASNNDQPPLSPENTLFYKLNDSLLSSLKNNFQNRKTYYYDLTKINSSPMTFRIITPYSALCYGYQIEKKTSIRFTTEDIQDIVDCKYYVFIKAFRWVKVGSTLQAVPVKNVVLRKKGIIYHSNSIYPLAFAKWGILSEQIWAFPIGLFDYDTFEIIAIDPIDQKQSIIKITPQILDNLK